MSSNEQVYENITKSVAHHEQDLVDICKKVHRATCTALGELH